jgi:group II intron reverse transcriptase/maturase
MPMDVDKMQTKLASWSQDPDFRFDDIYNLLYDEDWICRAYASVKSNSGSRTAGVDGQKMEDFEEDLEENLKELRSSLKSQSYNPKPVRRTYIPKGDGRERPLGIPTIKDRIIQESIRMVLEPIYETDFSDDSYGFRPNRNTHDARKQVVQATIPANPGNSQWVIDADIKGFFDNVDHRTLEQIIQDRITDRKMRNLIWGFLKAGVMEDGKFRHSSLGTPQGGIVSPVLANIYLNELDQWIKRWTEVTSAKRKRRRRRGKGSWQYVRYADDFLLMTNNRKRRAEKMLERVGGFVSDELNLKLSDKKSELVHIEDGFEFLGYKLKAKTSTGGLKRLIPKEAEREIKSKVRDATEGGTEVAIRTKLRAINSVLRGWANYYKYATNATKVFHEIDHIKWHKVTKWLSNKLERSRNRLVGRKLDGKYPIYINGVTVVKLQEMSDTYRKSHNRHEHPYLEGKNTGWEDLPEEEPWLANTENRDGDVRWKTLKRDNWNCQSCGRDLGGVPSHVHHKKKYGSNGDPDRLENLVSLCVKCHRMIESNRENANG